MVAGLWVFSVCNLLDVQHCKRFAQPPLCWSQMRLFPWPLFDLMQSGSLAHSLAGSWNKLVFVQGG